MVKTTGKLQQKLLERNDLSLVQEAINCQMKVAWSVNTRVFDVLKTVWAQDLGVGIPHSEKLTAPECPVPTKEALAEQKRVLTDEEQHLLKEWKMIASEVYTQEKERIAQAFQTTRIIKMANQYGQYASFWYVWYADFRGRLYTATAGFSPQGPDAAKGILRFSEGKPLGEEGLYWLKVHIANRYGFDKEDFPVRVAWTEERHDILLQIANDPIGNIHHWKDADKPYQFLAAVFEYAECQALVQLGYNASEYVSRLPIGLDGSCNGLQNFSAMLRDEVGGRATNLVPSDKPADIYSEVARVATIKVDRLSLEKAVLAKLQKLEGHSEVADEWLKYAKETGSGSLPRSLAKRPVMTLPYGATRQSCTQYIFQDIIKQGWTKKFSCGPWSAAVWLCPIVWEAIGEVVVAARQAMSWLQKLANGMSKINKPIVWKTKDGFIAVQASREIETVKINTQLAGRFQVKVGSFTDRLDANKQRSGISPNFVHSQDATHMRNTIRLAASHGIYNIACIHDDYGTYACDTGRFQRLIREAFVSMYRDFDPLQQLHDIAEAYGAKVPPVPAKGQLDLEAVLESRHFFG
jgi:DNA-directed RNA polymerase